MRILRGMASLMLLLVLLAAVPALLWHATETIEWAALLRPSVLLSPDDGTALLAIVVVLGWAAWAVFTACVLTETVTLLSRRRIRIRMPGLAGPQSWVAGLLISVAAMVAGPLSPHAQAASVPVAHVGVAVPDAAPPAAPAPSAAPPDASRAAVARTVGGLLAAALVAQVAGERAYQLAGRRLGRRIRHPEGAARSLEQTLRQRQDQPAMGRLQLAFATIGAHLHRRGVPAPPLTHVLVCPSRIEFHFARRPGPPPAGFCAAERTWILRGDCRLEAPPQAVYPWPAVVPLGTAAEGHEVLIDLEARGTTGIDAAASRGPGSAQAEQGRDLVHALIIELCSVPWGTDTEVVVVGGDDAFVRGLALPQLRAEPSIEGALTEFERRRAERGRANVAYRRLGPAAGETWRVHVLVVDAPLDETQHRRLAALGAGPESGLAVIADVPLGRSDLRLDPRGRCRGDGLPEVSGQMFDRSTRAALGHLHAASSDPRTMAAPWWDRSVGPPDHGQPSGMPRHGPLAPQVKLLGPIELSGAAGEPPARALRQCIEYAAWLLENPGATAPAMADALAVAEGTRRSNMSRLRTWLGRDPDGEPYLPEAYSGRIRLHADVSSDWQQLRLLTVAGVNRALEPALIAALELVRGAPLADAAPTQWHWAEELRTDISSMVRDIGAVLADAALARNDIDLARWAAARALTASPEDEMLLCARVRTEYQAANPNEVRRLALRLTRQARVLNIDLAEETVTLLQQVMEGRPRPRSMPATNSGRPPTG